MYTLQGRLRPYAWGSHTLIPELVGRPSPSEHPEAELWFGAHPGGPTVIQPVGPAVGHLAARADDAPQPAASGAGASGRGSGDGAECGTPEDAPRTLAELIASDPAYHLGDTHTELPFLLKILAADTTLSIQAHPSRAQAEEGCAAEDAEGKPRDAADRNYRDPNHKPELLVALGPFEALAGFRPIERTTQFFEALCAVDLPGESAELARFSGSLGSQDEEGDLRGLVTTWINLPGAVSSRLVTEVVARCEALAGDTATGPEGSSGPVTEPEPGDTPEWMRAAARNVVTVAGQYPGDPGILVCLLLNYIQLEAGEAIYLDAGQLHAYVRGLGVEIMANSDNVLRGGLTSKHIDVPELLKVLVPRSLEDPVTRVGNDGVFPTPAPDFRMRLVAPGAEGSVSGPAIILCAGGSVQVAQPADTDAASGSEGGEESVTLAPGEAVWVSAGEPAVVVRAEGGPGAFVATPGR